MSGEFPENTKNPAKEFFKSAPVIDFQVKIETLEKELAALKEENGKLRGALEEIDKMIPAPDKVSIAPNKLLGFIRKHILKALADSSGGSTLNLSQKHSNNYDKEAIAKEQRD